MITTKLAFNIRFERGLQLPVNREYEDPRVKEIAIEQEKLLNRMSDLDIELAALYNKCQPVESD